MTQSIITKAASLLSDDEIDTDQMVIRTITNIKPSIKIRTISSIYNQITNIQLETPAVIFSELKDITYDKLLIALYDCSLAIYSNCQYSPILTIKLLKANTPLQINATIPFNLTIPLYSNNPPG